MRLKKRQMLAVLAVGVSLAGCTHLDPVRVQADHGASNRAMVVNQYYDAEAARHPSSAAPTGLDGVKAEKILEAYREDNADRDFEDESTQINILTSPSGR